MAQVIAGTVSWRFENMAQKKEFGE